MDTAQPVKRSMEFPTKVLLSMFLLLFPLFVSLSAGHASDLTVVGGIVQRVSGTVIELGGKTYDIGKSRLSSASGKELPLPEIAPGKKVDLFIVKGKIDTVIIYPTGMVE
ncbi:MAG: hypothetical protein ACXWWV_08470 [Candidatus Deferrimicrobiaceae bacterium]